MRPLLIILAYASATSVYAEILPTNCSCTSAPLVTAPSLIDLLSLLPCLQKTNCTSYSDRESNRTSSTSFTLSDFMASLSSAGRVGPTPTSIPGIILQSSNDAVPSASKFQVRASRMVMVLLGTFAWIG